ncbi:OmpA family protein [Cedecea davisae]|uniref:OmpA family protein n=1 Tax=Cedecea davisae TaxID=158484 RepID=UPI001D0BBA11|nr:OmpA family protein [Cedecea davisae]
MSNYRKLLCGSFSLLFIAGMLFSGESHAANIGGSKQAPWVMDIPVSQNQWQVEDSRARIVIFRLQRQNDNFELLPLNIFINNVYHASLYPEHQAVALSLCPGKSALVIAPGNRKAGQLESELPPQILTPDLQAGHIYFYQIAMDNSGRTVGRWVEGEQAKSVLASVRIQKHTVSRVDESKRCPSQIYTINASALFRLAQYDEKSLLPGAIDNLKSLATKINNEYASISKIIVNGYADPMGKPEGNNVLSLLRANTIATQLVGAGLPSKIILARGHGSTNPVVLNCDKHKQRSEVITCNQPNRRVEIEVYGIKKDQGR